MAPRAVRASRLGDVGRHLEPRPDLAPDLDDRGDGLLDQERLVDLTPLPDSVPAVKEIGASSAPLLSAAFFIGARCRDYNDDYMQCKTEKPGQGEIECMKEGRRVTRCAASVYVPIPRTAPLCSDEKTWLRRAPAVPVLAGETRAMAGHG